MQEKRRAFLWTTENTFVKGGVEEQPSGILEVDIDYDTHPHLRQNCRFKIFAVLMEYKIPEDISLEP